MTQDVHLLVDVGNSRIKWKRAAIDDDPSQQPASAFAWDLELLLNLLDNNWASVQGVTKISIANVAGEKVQNILSQWCADHWKVTPQFATTAQQSGDVRNGYEDHQSLGIDRWLAIIAAHHLYPATTNIVIDCGSAITVDVVLTSGDHWPGPIMFGQQNMINSLLSKTDLARYMPEKEEAESAPQQPQAIVRDTKSAILSGAKFATSKALEAIVDEIEAKLPQSSNIQIIATGGAAQNVMALSTLSAQTNYLYEPDLVLKGLALYFEN